jgi:hypothetical protein
MEHWHVPYNYPRAEHAQAWLLKCFEGAIARDTDKDSDWMFKQRCVSKSDDDRIVGGLTHLLQRNHRTNRSPRTDKIQIASTPQSVREKEPKDGAEGIDDMGAHPRAGT